MLDRLEKEKIIPVIKITDSAKTEKLLSALQKGGITSAEITYRTAEAPFALKIAKEKFPNFFLGAGSVVSLSIAKEAVSLGVDFIVSPGFSVEIAKFCIESGVLYFGGAVTPTEIMTALSLGINVVKFFPAEDFGGIKTIKSLSQPFPNVKFMPTGGINENNISDYLALPMVIACGGSWMVKPQDIDNENFEKITELARQVKERISL